jgi:putative transposase
MRYQPLGESGENRDLLNSVSQLLTDEPQFGVLGIQDECIEPGFRYGTRQSRQFLRKMGIEAIYPRRNLTHSGFSRYFCPPLLLGVRIEHQNKVWAIDVTFIPMKDGLLYLTAIMDLYSRCVVGWQLSPALDRHTKRVVLEKAIDRCGIPKVVNSYSGHDYCGEDWTGLLRDKGIQCSLLFSVS